MRVDDLMQRILHETSAYDYQAFLTGSNNFRVTVNPEYKANRKDMVKPQWLEQCREHLVVKWKAQVTDGYEADDSMGIEQTKSPDTIICTIDKDLLQVPGQHYNFVKQEFKTVSPKEGLFNFYWQCIMGDRTDNVFGFDGLARNTIPKKLEYLYEEMQHASHMGTERDIFDIVRSMYDDDERLLMNGRCLWIQREPEQMWEFPIGET